MILQRNGGVMAVATLTLALLTACEHAPLEPAGTTGSPAPAHGAASGAEQFEDADFYDVTDTYVRFACDDAGNYIDGDGGELVRMHGGIFSRFFVVMTPSGKTAVNYKTMPVGLGGVGVESGEVFRVRDAETGNSLLTEYDAVNSYRHAFTMVGAETGRRMTLVFGGTFTMRGERIVIERQRERIECRA